MKEHRGTKVPALASYWTIPQHALGETVYVLGNGPSLRDLDMARLSGRCVVAVNSAIFLARHVAAYLFFGDARWYWSNRAAVDALPQIKVSVSRYWVDADGARREQPVGERQGVRIVAQDGIAGLSDRPDAVRWNCSSGGAAIDFAAHLGAARIVMLGYDMHGDAAGLIHAYQALDERILAIPEKIARMNRPHIWRAIWDAGRARGIEIVNATPQTAVRGIPRVRLEDAL